MKHTTVIDIGSSKVSCMSAGTAADGALVIHGIESRRYPGYRLGSLPRSAGLIEALDSALAALQENTGLHIRSVSVGVPAPFVRTAVTYGEIEVDSRNNRVTAADMDWLFDTASDFELPEGYELMHSTPFDYRLDGAPCDGDPIGLPADKLAASFCHAFVDSRFASLVTGILDGFGITVSSFVSCSMACSSFTIPFEERMRGAVLIDCGGTHTDVSAIRGNALVRTESIGIGGVHITNDIALGLRLPDETAEELKRRYVFGLDYSGSCQLVRIPGEGVFEIEDPTLQMIIEARAEELADALAASLDSIEAELPESAPVYMVGGGVASMRGGAEYLSKKTGREILLNMPRLNRLNTVSHAPVLALAQFMLYGGASAKASRQGRGRILGGLREIISAGAALRR
ncbi:MAG: rod shape-determining protein [Clostridia bacterium]|nr:rod shape-determining protein [Clostridia bacterium]